MWLKQRDHANIKEASYVLLLIFVFIQLHNRRLYHNEEERDQLLSSINFAIKAIQYSNYLDFTLLNILRLTTGFTSPMASKLEYRRPGCKDTCAP